jgi:glycosyltransferase involved in cell wall biosynthesis
VIVETHNALPVVPHGKFFRRGLDKFFLKAVHFGAKSGALRFEEKIALRKRLCDLRAAHTTAVLVDDNRAPLLDLAGELGLYAIVQLQVLPCDLFSTNALRAAVRELRTKISSLRGHPLVIGYLLDCPIEPDVLRFRGLDTVRSRLRKVVDAIHQMDPPRMVGLKHRAGTLGLNSLHEDFLCVAMPSLAPAELRSWVIRLHNVAGARPLVLGFEQAASEQDELIACAFGLGAAGLVVPERKPVGSFRDGSLALKMLHASEVLPFLTLNGSCPPQPEQTPKVSVVICAYNAERTIRLCLESLERLDYPNFEVIIVDDGSSDATAEIAAKFPNFRLIRQRNRGLSVARNVGMQAAGGDLIAYTDSDCVVDPHWLTFMVRSMLEGGFDGCGGPNYPPHEEGWIEGCVAASPGAPSHVLIDDERAEHLAGCNMMFRKSALLALGGFDPQFTAAGDDVDICWRLMDAGYALGYCPSAFVWHFRRNTIGAYYGQQRGYGRAEALLFFKYPERFNILGQIRWKGIIPGASQTTPGNRPLRVKWARTAEQLQRVDERPLNVLRVAPMTAEWSVAAGLLLVLSLLLGVSLWPALVLVAASPLWATHYALQAPLEECHKGTRSRILIGWLAYTGSIVRAIARYRCRLDVRRRALFERAKTQQPSLDWKRRSLRLSYWNNVYTTREALLENLRRLFRSFGRPAMTESGWNDFDLLVQANPWARIQIKTAEEELGGLELKTNVEAKVRLTNGARVVIVASMLLAASGLLFGSPFTAAVLSIASLCTTAAAILGLINGGSLAYDLVERAAADLNLVPLGRPLQNQDVTPTADDSQREQPTEVAQPAGR